MLLPWATALDIEYTGQHAFNLVENVDINGVDFGSAYLPANQDPTIQLGDARRGGRARDNMRAFRGYKRHHAGGGARLPRRAHAAVLAEPPVPQRLLVRLQRRHPPVAERQHDRPPAAQRGWQLHRALGPGAGRRAARQLHPRPPYAEGGTRLGAAEDPQRGVRAQGARPHRQRLAGLGRVDRHERRRLHRRRVRTRVARPATATRTSPVRRPTAAASASSATRAPAAAAIRSGSSRPPASPVRWPTASASNRAPTICAAASRARSTWRWRARFRIHGEKQLQFRLDVFNVMNQSIVTGRNTTVSLTSPTDGTMVNLPYDATRGDRRLAVAAEETPAFGVANAYQAPRTLQAQIRFSFLTTMCEGGGARRAFPFALLGDPMRHLNRLSVCAAIALLALIRVSAAGPIQTPAQTPPPAGQGGPRRSRRRAGARRQQFFPAQQRALADAAIITPRQGPLRERLLRVPWHRSPRRTAGWTEPASDPRRCSSTKPAS